MKFGTNDWGKDLTKTAKWYIGPIKEWETNLYGYELNSGVGDFIYNNCRMIMETEDQSEWAYNLLVRCFDLLRWRQRWPGEIQVNIPPERQCTTRFGSWVHKIKKRICKKCSTKQRSWHDMTRDPYIAAFTCARWMRAEALIETVSIPWYLYRPNTWAWHKYLKNPTDRNLRGFDFWNDLSGISPQGFVRVLKEMMHTAVYLTILNEE